MYLTELWKRDYPRVTQGCRWVVVRLRLNHWLKMLCSPKLTKIIIFFFIYIKKDFFFCCSWFFKKNAFNNYKFVSDSFQHLQKLWSFLLWKRFYTERCFGAARCGAAMVRGAVKGIHLISSLHCRAAVWRRAANSFLELIYGATAVAACVLELICQLAKQCPV